MPYRSQITLIEVKALTGTLAVRCSRCQRKGRLNIGERIAVHGPGFPLPALARTLNADCPQRDVYNLRDRCDVHFPGLAALMGV